MGVNAERVRELFVDLDDVQHRNELIVRLFYATDVGFMLGNDDAVEHLRRHHGLTLSQADLLLDIVEGDPS